MSGVFHRFLAVIVAVVGVLMAVRSFWYGTSDVLQSKYLAACCYASLGGVTGLLLWQSERLRGRPVRVVGLAMAYGGAALMLLATAARIPKLIRDIVETPIGAAGLQSLTGTERAEWAVRVAAHALTGKFGASSSPSTLSIPAEWPFPDDVELAVRGDALSGRTVWARTTDRRAACITWIPSDTGRGDATDESVRCGVGFARIPADAAAMPVRRAPIELIAVASTPPKSDWLQYRHTAKKDAALGASVVRNAPWHASVSGELRSSVAGAEGIAFVGAHGTGSFEAFDSQTGVRRWRARVPNWIHEDAVTDGHVVAVGFGDNTNRSFRGRAPSGVAAFDLATGRLRWTAFERTSVMSSPVIAGGSVFYGTQQGLIQKRSLLSGAPQGSVALDGAIDMAPPAATGDTLIASLEPNRVCAVIMSEMRTLWCRVFPERRGMGHAGPAIVEGNLIVSMIEPMRVRDWWADLGWLGMRREMRMLWRAVVGQNPAERGQQVVAVRVADGETMWISDLAPSARPVEGHMSGTAAIQDGIGVVVLPPANTVIGFEVASGRFLWKAEAHNSRGPPLLIGDLAVVSGRDGVIQTLDYRSGELRCVFRVPVGSDRAGPTFIDGLVVFPSLDGRIDAIPVADIERCDAVLGELFARQPGDRADKMHRETH
jgi:outer membrane protein assembly factor BamB